MRVLHVIPYFYPGNRFGGVPEAVRSLVNAQASLGYEIYVLTTDAGLDECNASDGLKLDWRNSSSVRAIGELSGIKIIYVPNRYPFLVDRKFFTAPFWNDETKELLSASIDIAHFHEVHIPGYRLAAQELRKRGARVCLSCHGSLFPPVHSGLRRLAHTVIDPILRRGWFDNVSVHIALCENEKKQLLKCGVPENRIHIIPHGLPSFGESFETLPYPVSRNERIPTFLYLGRINKAKGILVAVEAFCELMRSGFDARFICCGPDEGCAKTIRRICAQKQIVFERNAVSSEPGLYLLDEISHRSIPTLLSHADCSICPSPYESFGLVPIESLMCGVPVIVSSSYGCLEHLTEFEDLVSVYPFSDGRRLRELMGARQIRNNEERNKIRFGSLLPSWKQVAARLDKIYASGCLD